MSNLVRISIGYFLLAPFVLAGCGGGDDGPVIDRGKPFDVSGGATNPPKGSTEVAPGESQAVAYPEGPYGTDSGAIAPNLTFLGWKNPTAANYDSNSFEHVSFADFYDPDGSKGIKLLLINASAVWCGPCNAEAAEIRNTGKYAEYSGKGVQFMWSLFEDANHDPSKPQDAVNWTRRYQVDYAMVLDPTLKFGAFFPNDATPLNVVIDTRTMRILEVATGALLGDPAWTFVNRHL